MMTYERITQMFNEDSDDDELYTDSTVGGGCIGPKTWCGLYTSATYTRVYMVILIVNLIVYLDIIYNLCVHI